ncbi:MAG: hypothetical protein IJU76_08080 [Desulfovibrionaceae bacterium]|nr:hypothetical protein [Desulfovibrionaceae bacterium]
MYFGKPVRVLRTKGDAGSLGSGKRETVLTMKRLLKARQDPSFAAQTERVTVKEPYCTQSSPP